MKILNDPSTSVIHCHTSPYPSELVVISNKTQYKVPPMATAFGVIDGEAEIISAGTKITFSGQKAFSLNEGEIICRAGKVAIFTRFGFRGFNSFGVDIETIGRLSYIDGCTDTLLIYPPRLGDPCLNALYFPTDVEQTMHAHPSIRLGYVLRGSGISELEKETKPLKQGDAFLIEAFERHRFITQSVEMVVIAYHPESDWGPTDEMHPMINRTYLNLKK